MTCSPLVAPEVDLRDFQFMPLEVVRLRDSDLAARVNGEEFRAAVLLWCAAWHQQPAASLPEDDVVLATLAGFGRAVKDWLAVKDGALRGWIKCSDGRLYHPTVAEKANDAWRQKQVYAWRKECDRIRKENVTREKRGLPPLEMPRKSVATPAETDAAPDGIPAENALKGAEQNRTEQTRDELKISLPISLEAARAEKRGGENFDRFWKAMPNPDPAAKAEASSEFAKLSNAEQDQAIAAGTEYATSWRKKPTTHSRSPAKFLRERQFEGFASVGAEIAVKFRHHRDSPQGRAHEADWRARLGKPPPWTDDHWYFDTDWPASGEVG